MSFITENDYPERLKATNLDAMCEGDEVIRLGAEETAVAIVAQYLFQRYDTTLIFAQTGTNRNRALVAMCVSIALYYLYQRLPKRQLPDWVLRDYENALDFLDKVSDGKITMDLPRKLTQQQTPKTKFRAGASQLRPE
jgi:phage gp36-like protein